MAAAPGIVGANLLKVKTTLLAVLMEVTVSQNQDGSGTGCWRLDDQGVTRLRARHGNFSYAQRGGAGEYLSCRLVGESGNSSFYVIHQVSTIGSGLNDEFKQGGLDASHLCPHTNCWNPHHIVSENRAANLARRNCVGDIVDGEGLIVHHCLCPRRKCVGTQNVRLREVIDRENLRVIESKTALKDTVHRLSMELGINNIDQWSLLQPYSTVIRNSNFALTYANWRVPGEQ
jgi:hypothetical protein